MNPLVTLSNRNGVAVVHINNPPVNALTTGVPEGLASSVNRAEKDPDVRAIVVMGAGRTFIAGADIKELERAAHGEDAALPNLHDLLQQLEDCSKPIVMALHGTALGGGLEVAMAGHYRVAVRDARMGQPEVNLGVMPGYGGSQRLARLVGEGRALELLLTGTPIDAAEAHRIGLVNRVVPAAELMTAATGLAVRLAAQAPLATRYILEAVHRGRGLPLGEAQAVEAALFGLLAATEDMHEGTKAFVEKRPAVFKGR